MQTMPVVLNSGVSVKEKVQNMCHKNVLQKGLETKKWLRRGLNPQLSWLTAVCLRGLTGMYHRK